MICRLCLQEKELVKAHVIPEAFFVAINTDRSNPSKLITNADKKFPKKSPIGVYDKKILCSECESIFGMYDDYAISVFRDKKVAFKDLTINGKLEGYLVESDYKKLKFFFISMLWRAGVSTHDFYAKVNLGPHQEALRVLVKERTETPPAKYSVLLAQFSDDPEIVPMLGPWRNKVEGGWHYNFVFYGYQATIRVASHPLSSEVKGFILSPEKEVPIIFREYKGSIYHTTALEVAKLQPKGLFKS